MRNPLLFIDTNILLDFYRNRGDAGIALLGRLDSLHDRIIGTYQVEMEFKKNRQNVIVSCLTDLKEAGGGVSAPGFLSSAKSLEIIHRQRKDNAKRLKELKDRITKVLANPTINDPVFKVTQRLFAIDSAFYLQRTDKRKYQLRRAAWKRFSLGYPPRKKNDTSTGDGINWEWIVECVKRSNRDVVVVSRDADYGVTVDGQSYVNDWLQQELRERTKKSRSIALYDRLSEALRRMDVEVTDEEVKAENEAANAGVTRKGRMADSGLSLAELIEKYLNLDPAAPSEQEGD
jgi:PIN domain